MILLPRHFVVVEPRDLPLPHNPVNCRFYDPALWNSTLSLTVVRARWAEAAKIEMGRVQLSQPRLEDGG